MKISPYFTQNTPRAKQDKKGAFYGEGEEG